MKKPLAVYILFALHLFLGISDAAGGAMLVIKTDGSLLGMEAGWLTGSPFTTYLIPGLALFFINGVFPLMVFTGLVTRLQWKWAGRINMYKNMHWAWTCSLYSGIIVISWIIIQMLLTRYFWLQPCIISLGLLIIVFSLLPPVIRYYQLKH
jgi:hypothetical protein